jgi:hypothetical protein
VCGKAAELIHDFTGNLRGQSGLAAAQGTDGFEQFVFVRVFQQVRVRTGAHRFEHRFVVIERRQHENLRAGERPRDLARGGDAPFQRHVQIHQNHVGPQ